MKYLVMEARPSYAILLDEEGRFVRAANLHYEPGQTVEHIVPMRTRAPKSKGVLIWLPGVLAAACLVLMAAVLLRAPITPYASVYLTINPQVRIDVDRQSMTQGLEGVNPDGQDLVEGYDWKGKHLDQVTDELIDRAVDHLRQRYGYMSVRRALLDTDPRLGHINVRDDHTVHPVGYFGG